MYPSEEEKKQMRINHKAEVDRLRRVIRLMWHAAFVVLLMCASVGGTWYVMNTYTVEYKDAYKEIYDFFCNKRAEKFRADKDAQKVCENGWSAVTQAAIDSNVVINPIQYMAVVEHESRFCKYRIGLKKGSFDVGCAQINVAVHGRYPYGCDVLEEWCNLYSGARLYADLIKQFRDERLARLAYNRGPGAVWTDLRYGINPDNGYLAKTRIQA